MTVTVLAIVFMILILAVAIFGFKAIIRPGNPPHEADKERCSLCGKSFLKSHLIERQVGDYRLFLFCGSCITSLHNELLSKN